MRNTKINIYQASQKDRIKLYDHLIALGEELYSGIKLCDTEYSYIMFKYNSGVNRWSGIYDIDTEDAISIDEFIEKYPVTKQESEKDYAIICKYSSLKDRKLIYSHLKKLNYKMYEDTGFITHKKYTSSDTVYTYDNLQWQTNGRENISKHLKVISVKDFIAKFIKTSNQSPSKQEPSMQIGQKYKNSSGTINTIIKVGSTQIIYKSEKDNKEYFCTIANVKKNWKLLPEAEITSTTTSYQIIKKDKYEVGAKVKIREDLKKHYNTNFNMCKLAGKVIVITGYYNKGYTFEGWEPYYWSADMFEGEVIEPQNETQQPVSQEQKFKVGDKVKLKSELEDRKLYNGLTCFEIFKSNMPTGIISKTQKSSEGSQYYIDDIWYGEDTLELDISSPLTIVPTANTTVKTVQGTLVVQGTLISPAASAVTIKKFDGVTGTPFGGTNQPTIKREKKSMAKAIKDTAIATLDQNKQAAIIAGKMEAGRILNKQVIKQIKPHIPMFIRGYLDTPLAPVVVANLVAAIGNHTQNKRVQQVSELMLLAAADTTVQSFNLDKIIDDVLAGVKLPAGILDTDEE